jgi:uncharacterized protein YceK
MALLMGIVLLNGCGEKPEEAAKKVGEKTQRAIAAAKKMMESATAWTTDKMNAYADKMQRTNGKIRHAVWENQ